MSSSREHLGAFTSPSSLRFERLLAGPKMRVWDFLTKRELLRLWLAEGAISERVGSSVVLDFDRDEGSESVSRGALILGTVFRCELGSVLSYSWSDKKTESIVTFELESVGQKVRLVLTHEDLPESLVALCGAGWHTHLEALKARLDGMEPEPFVETFNSVLPLYREKVEALSATNRD